MAFRSSPPPQGGLPDRRVGVAARTESASLAAERRFRGLAVAASHGSLLLAAAGLAILACWSAGITPSFSGRLQTPVPNTGLGLALLGIGMWLVLPAPSRPAEARTGALLAGLSVLALATLSGLQDLFALNLGVDTVLVDASGSESLTGEPGRMAPVGAMALMAAGGAIAVRAAWRGRTAAVATDVLGLAAIGAGLLSLMSFMYGLDDGGTLVSFSPMALESTLALLVAGVLCLTLSGPSGMVGDILLGPSLTAAIVRRLALPGVIGLLFMSLGYDSLYKLEVIDQQFRVAILTLTGCMGLVTLCYAAGWRMERIIAGQQEELVDLSVTAATDYLTGLANRQAFDAELAIAVDRARRSGRALAVVMLDVVNLKGINDSLGHEEGDRALRQVADFLRASLRDSDIVGRWGGDEFAALCPNLTEAAAERVISRLEQGPDGGVQLRSGCAQLREGETAEALLARADHALVEAKRDDPRPRGLPHLRPVPSSRPAG